MFNTTHLREGASVAAHLWKHATDCRATSAWFRAQCESVLFPSSEPVLLCIWNSPSWPSRSRGLVSVVTHLHEGVSVVTHLLETHLPHPNTLCHANVISAVGQATQPSPQRRPAKERKKFCKKESDDNEESTSASAVTLLSDSHRDSSPQHHKHQHNVVKRHLPQCHTATEAARGHTSHNRQQHHKRQHSGGETSAAVPNSDRGHQGVTQATTSSTANVHTTT